MPAVRRDAEQSDRDGRVTLSIQWLQLDVLEPARAAVVLQTDVAAMRVILVGDVELVRAAVRTFVRLSELAEVRNCHALAVEHDFNAAPVHCDLDAIPRADRFQGVLRRLDQIVNCARVVVARARRVVDR